MSDPMVVHATELRPEWMDYNGHLSEAYYVLVFGHATDDVMDVLGLDAAYRAETGGSLFTVEAHVRYLDQVVEHSDVEVRSWVIGVAGKRLRLWHELWADGGLRATEEVLALHVDTRLGRSTELPSDVVRRAETLLTNAPDEAGRSIRPVD